MSQQLSNVLVHILEKQFGDERQECLTALRCNVAIDLTRELQSNVSTDAVRGLNVPEPVNLHGCTLRAQLTTAKRRSTVADIPWDVRVRVEHLPATLVCW
jgi:hypothetical protein